MGFFIKKALLPPDSSWAKAISFKKSSKIFLENQQAHTRSPLRTLRAAPVFSGFPLKIRNQEIGKDENA
jgi:hypothetical protein